MNFFYKDLQRNKFLLKDNPFQQFHAFPEMEGEHTIYSAKNIYNISHHQCTPTEKRQPKEYRIEADSISSKTTSRVKSHFNNKGHLILIGTISMWRFMQRFQRQRAMRIIWTSTKSNVMFYKFFPPISRAHWHSNNWKKSKKKKKNRKPSAPKSKNIQSKLSEIR